MKSLERLKREENYDKALRTWRRPLTLVKRGTCRCKYPGCGALLDIVTHVHAEKHGFKNKQEFIAAGMVEYL